MDIASTSSQGEMDDETNVIINSVNLAASKEGKLKGLPHDVTYAMFAGKTPADVYDKICSISHFGHVANRILRKLISAGFVDPQCGNTLGKNRKVRADQKRYFEGLSEMGVQFLHQAIKAELDVDGNINGIVLPPYMPVSVDSQDLLANKRAAAKKAAEASLSSSSSNNIVVVGAKRPAEVPAFVAAPIASASVSSSSASGVKKVDYEAMTKTDLVEVLSSVFKTSRHAELQQQAIAKEAAEKAHFAALQKQTTLAHKQASIKFLQEQLKETKLTPAKKKEFETKLEELLATICEEM